MNELALRHLELNAYLFPATISILFNGKVAVTTSALRCDRWVIVEDDARLV